MTEHEPSEKNSFWKIIFSQTISFIRENPSVWFFGCLLSVPIPMMILLESLVSRKDIDLLLIAPKIIALLILCVFLFFSSEAGLILELKKRSHSLLEYVAATGALIRWYFFFLIILLGFFAFFFFPITITPVESRTLIQLVSFTFFLVVVGGLFILKSFGEFYLLLSRLSIGSAFRSAANLFMDHFMPSVQLLGMTVILSYLGGTLLDFTHTLFQFPISHFLIRDSILLLSLFILATIINIFIRIYWYFFFQMLAAEKPNGWQEKKKMVQESMVPAEDEA